MITEEEREKIYRLLMNALNMITKAEYILKKGSEDNGEGG